MTMNCERKGRGKNILSIYKCVIVLKEKGIDNKIINKEQELKERRSRRREKMRMPQE